MKGISGQGEKQDLKKKNDLKSSSLKSNQVGDFLSKLRRCGENDGLKLL